MTRPLLAPSSLLLAALIVACSEDPPENAQPAAGSSGTAGVAGAAGAAGAGQGGAGGGGAAGSAGEEPVVLTFEARVGAEPFSCQKTFAGLGAQKTAVEPLDFRLYIHDVRLLAEGGAEVPLALDQDGVWQHQDLALLDFEDKTGTCSNGTTNLNTTVRGKAPAGSYRGVRFKVGVPFALNHGDSATAPSPLNLSTMFWSWNGGYKFVRIDTRNADGAPKNLHLGSTGCAEEGGAVVSCTHPNRPEITLDNLDLAAGKILVDYAAIVADVDLSKEGGGAPGCMSGLTDPECAPIFQRLGLSLETGAPADGQSVFRVE